jgi:hypothetical protein
VQAFFSVSATLEVRTAHLGVDLVTAILTPPPAPTYLPPSPLPPTPSTSPSPSSAPRSPLPLSLPPSLPPSIAAVHASSYFGMSLGYPLTETFICISGAWGVLLWREMTQGLNIGVFVLSTALIVAGAALLVTSIG